MTFPSDLLLARPRTITRRASATRVRRSRRITSLEQLEDRAVPTVLLDITAGALTYTEQTPGTTNNTSVSSTGLAGVYTFSEAGDTITLGAGAAGWILSNGGHVATGPATSVTSIKIDTGDGPDILSIRSIDAPTTILPTNGGSEIVTVGDLGGVQGIRRSLSVLNPANFTNLVIDDSGDATATPSVALSATQLTGLAPATISFIGSDLSSLTVKGGTSVNTFTVNATPTATITALYTGATTNPAGNTVFVKATDTAGIDIHDQAYDTVTIGDSTGLQNIKGPISVTNTSAKTALTLDDSPDTLSQTIAVSPTQVTFTTPAFPVSFTAGQLSSLTIKGGSGGNTFNVNGTPGTGSTTLNTGTGTGGNTVNVFATANALNINSQASDTINLGQNGSMSGITGAVTFTGSPADVILNDQSDSSSVVSTLGVSGGVATLIGFPGPINYTPSLLHSLTINGGSGTDVLTLFFNGGNPLPVGTGNNFSALDQGLNFNGGGGPNTIDLLGNPSVITNETYTASGPGAGNLNIGGTSLNFTGLKPINDILAVTNYTFTAPATPGQFVKFSNGPIFAFTQTATISDGTASSPPAFELANIANKTNVALSIGEGNTLDEQASLNNTIAPAGLSTLTVRTGNGNDLVNVVATLAGVATSIQTNSGNDVTNVTVSGLAAGSTLVVNGGPGGNDVLNIDAAGQTSANTSTPGLVSFSPSTATVSYSLVENVNVRNLIDQPLTAFPSTINALKNVALVNIVAGSFTDADPNAKATDFVASINWGDGTPTTPGVVVANGTGSFSVLGSHTYHSNSIAPFALTVTVTDTGSKGTTISGGVTITTSDNGGSTASILSSATVTSSPIAANAAPPITTAVEGKALISVPVATFTDADPLAAIGDFAATIDWGDGSPNSAGIITQPGGVGTAFTVRGTHVYTEENVSTLPVVVTITDTIGFHAFTTSSVLGVADAALSTPGPLPVSAVEGTAVTNVPVVTFTDTNPLATVSDFTAIITWGDGGMSTGILQLISGTASGANFEVLGSHLYAAAGTYPISVAVLDAGGQTITPTSTAIVAAAPLTPYGKTITGEEGRSLASTALPTGQTDVLVATYSSANPGATVAGFTANIGWGDGSTSAATRIVATGTANGVTFSVYGNHTYAETATYSVSVAIVSASNATTYAGSTAVIADAPLSASLLQPLISTTEAQPSTAEVTSFVDANPFAPLSDFRATIDWGDGTPQSAGSISQPGGAGSPFLVFGTHTYADSLVNGGSGTFPVTIYVNDKGGASVNLLNTATVQDVPIILVGQLNPASDSGASSTDGITNVTQPNFFGTSEPLSTIHLFATPSGGGPLALIGQGTTDTSGHWSITSDVKLADGSYIVQANALDASGHTTAGSVVQTSSTGGPLVIDTVGPKVTYVQFDRLNGAIDVTYQDERSGLNLATVEDASNYHFAKQKGSLPGKYLVTALNPTSGGPTDPVTVPVELNFAKSLRGGFYIFTIDSGGVRDIAGNALDGEFYGFFPSGNNVVGGNFVARLDAIHHTIYPAQTVVGPASPVYPPGTLPGPVHIPTHHNGHATSVKAKVVAPVHHLAVHDAALSLVHVPRRRHR